MNLENFGNYLQNPALLYQLNYDELKNLVLEYPYSANLRLLLLIKSRIEKDDKWEDYLAKAASHTIDRAYLYDLIKSSEKVAPIEALELGEEYLELKSLTELDALQQEHQAALLETHTKQEVNTINDLNFTLASPLSLDEVDPDPEPVLPVLNKKNVVHQPDPVSTNVPLPSDPLTLDIQAFGYMLEQIGILPSPKPLAKEEFKKWRPDSSRSSARDHTQRIKQKRLRQLRQKSRLGMADKPVSKRPVKQIARQSLIEHPDLASETLARLLVEQERYGKAIEMYQRLSLKNPEKSAFFAGIIENLKQKL